MIFLLQPLCSSGSIFSSSKNLQKLQKFQKLPYYWQTRDGTIIVQCITFSSIFLTQNRPSISQPIRHLFIFIQNLIQLKSSSFMQACRFNPETMTSISSWSFPIRDFPTLLRDHFLSNSQALLLLIVLFLRIFQLLCIYIVFHTTPKHSTLICIRYFVTFLGLSIQLSK